MKFTLTLIRTYFRVLSVALPKQASKNAFQLFQKTSKKKFKPKEADFYASSNYFLAESNHGTIRCYELGNPSGELVFLVHGWNSNAGSMSGIGQILADQGYHVISFDLPAHGKSNAKHTNLLICGDVLQAVLRRVRTDEPITLVAHSFGSLVSAYALSSMSIKVKNLVYLTAPDTVSSIFTEFRDTIGLGNKAYNLLVKHTESLLQEKLEDLSVLNKLKHVNYDKLELIHDVHDKVIPYANSLKLIDQLPKNTLHSFQKIGHYRMLWNPDVIETVATALIEKSSAEQHIALEVIN